jgi:hypothetical protein
MNELKPEAGKFYRTVNRKKFRCYATDGYGSYPVHGALLNQHAPGWTAERYTADGKYSAGINLDLDLVAEWLDLPAYPWDIIPPWFNWCAVDENGECFAYSDKPEPREHCWWNDEGLILRFPKEYTPALTCNWKDSLAERPKKEGK